MSADPEIESDIAFREKIKSGTIDFLEANGTLPGEMVFQIASAYLVEACWIMARKIGLDRDQFKALLAESADFAIDTLDEIEQPRRRLDG